MIGSQGKKPPEVVKYGDPTNILVGKMVLALPDLEWGLQQQSRGVEVDFTQTPWIGKVISRLENNTITVSWYNPSSTKGLDARFHPEKGTKDVVHVDSLCMWNFDLLNKGYLPKKVKDQVQEIMPEQQRLLLELVEERHTESSDG